MVIVKSWFLWNIPFIEYSHCNSQEQFLNKTLSQYLVKNPSEVGTSTQVYIYKISKYFKTTKMIGITWSRGGVKEKFETYPSGFEKFLLEFICRVLKGKLLASDVIDRWAVLQLQEEVIFKSDLSGFFLVLEINVNRQLKPCVALLLYRIRGFGQNWNIWYLVFHQVNQRIKLLYNLHQVFHASVQI